MNSLTPLQLNDLKIGNQAELSGPIDLIVGTNRFVTIMGENGCGKTSLVNCLLGVQEARDGEILFWGRKNIGDHRAAINAQVGWVISQKETYPIHLSVAQFLKGVAALYPTWNWQLCDQLCAELGLETQKKLIHLSLGEHSKVRLIKALAFEPSLVVLDELTANLSPQSKEVLLATLLSLFASLKMSVLYVCHFKEEAIRLSDQIFEMTRAGLRLIGGQNA